MKRILLFLLIFLPAYLSFNLYFLDKIYFLSPIEYKTDIIIRSDSRGDGFFAANRNGSRIHQGLDLFAPLGAKVLAAQGGLVISVRENRGMGRYVVIRHLGGITTIYGHLLKIYAFKNQFVRQGDLIGLVGKTGNANHPAIQPHLHFEVRENGIPQDPLGYLE
jgi:murein DD-endopeptidase MepM/ murein hydrolase activator NlpD